MVLNEHKIITIFYKRAANLMNKVICLLNTACYDIELLNKIIRINVYLMILLL